jgi:sigma-E factor negative regulatory protein RseA
MQFGLYPKESGPSEQEQEMTQELSSLMDGELDPRDADRAIHACRDDDQRKQTWLLYHAIGESMRSQVPRALTMPPALERALQAEPAMIARPRPVPRRVLARVAMAAAASVATVGVVGWLGGQDGSPVGNPETTVAKAGPAGASAIQPVASTTTVQAAPAINVQEYLVAHRQVPSPDLYRPVTNRTPVVAR